MDVVLDVGLIPFSDGRVGVFRVTLVELVPGCGLVCVALFALFSPRVLLESLMFFHVSAQRSFVLDLSLVIGSFYLRSVSGVRGMPVANSGS